MATISVIDIDGQQRTIDLVPNLTLMELLRDEGYDSILALCGGSCSCATCHVHINDAPESLLEPIEEDEEMLITEADGYKPEVSRLSCQITLTESHDGLVVQLVDID